MMPLTLGTPPESRLSRPRAAGPLIVLLDELIRSRKKTATGGHRFCICSLPIQTPKGEDT